MQDSKDTAWVRDNGDQSDQEAAANDRESGVNATSGVHAGDATDPDGWQQYRRWISKAPAPRGRRTGVDPSLYTWKGYRNWSEQIKRNWQDS
jgi:hypothetical protein